MAVLIKNNASQTGAYFVNGKEYALRPGKEVRVDNTPTWATKELKVVVLTQPGQKE